MSKAQALSGLLISVEVGLAPSMDQCVASDLVFLKSLEGEVNKNFSFTSADIYL